MKVTIAVYLNDTAITNSESLQNLRRDSDVDILFLTEKKRYELPESQLAEINKIGATVQKEATVQADGVVFTLSSDEDLHALAVEYIRDFYLYNDRVSTIPEEIRELFISTANGVIDQAPHVDTSAISNFLVSCIVPIYNAEKYLHDAIDSVVAQTIGFEENIQLILINDGSSDGSRNICEEYAIRYPNNVIYVDQANAGVSAARNVGLGLVDGVYTFFLDADDYIDNDILENGIARMAEYESQIDFVSFPLSFCGNRSGRSHPLDYRFEKTRIVDIRNKGWHFVEHRVAACLFRSSALANFRFNENLSYTASSYFVLQLLRDKSKYLVSNDSNYYMRISSEDTLLYDNLQQHAHWDTEFLHMAITLIEEELTLNDELPKYTQAVIAYEMQLLNQRATFFKTQLPHVIDNFNTSLSDILQHIDDNIIKSQKMLTHWQKIHLLEMKHGKASFSCKDVLPGFYIGGVKREQLMPPIHVSIVEEYNNEIVIAGSYHTLDSKKIELVALYNDVSYSCIFHSTSYRDILLFGSICYRSNVFEIRIPFAKKGDIRFYAKADGYGLFPVRLALRVSSRMRNKHGALVLGDNCLLTLKDSNTLSATPLSTNVLNNAIIRYYSTHFSSEMFEADVAVLKEYMKIYPFYSSRRIWVFMDRRERADDNAEHLFRYCANLDDGIDKYFVLEHNSPDVERLQKYGKVLFWGSTEHKLVHLFAELYISSQFTRKFFFPFGDEHHTELFMGLSKAKLVGLQHGIMLSDMSAQFSRWDTNAKLFVTSTESEYKSLLNYDYCYGEKIVKLTGLPRYDNLTNKPQKQILFMFTWRKSLAQVNLDLSGSIYIYNPDFKNSWYFKCIQALLTDERLLRAADALGYELVYRPHPNVYIQLEDFSFSDKIIISQNDESYQKLFAESAIAVTDYTSAIFDFAYLKKPMAYYQFSKNNWGDGYFDYENMGFGPVVTEQNDLVEQLIEYMQSGCKMPNIYQKRVDDFFAYSDSSNCKRVYDAILAIE